MRGGSSSISETAGGIGDAKEMSKQKLGPDNWLHLLTHAVVNCAQEGGLIEVTEDEEIGAIAIYLLETDKLDGRLHPAFKALIDAHLVCSECGQDVKEEEYMVNDEVWAAAGAGAGRLCIGCLESRLGRRVGPADFSQYGDTLMNDTEGGYKSRRLLSRLTGRPGGDR